MMKKGNSYTGDKSGKKVMPRPQAANRKGAGGNVRVGPYASKK